MRREPPAGGRGAPLAQVPPGVVTGLLKAWKRGDPKAESQLLPLVYGELRRQAAWFLRGERADHTLVATDLVHEVYLRMTDQAAAYENRSQFFALAARMMRRVLVDHARARAAAKRPQPGLQVTFEEKQLPAAEPRAFELLALDSALTELAAFDPRQARLVELRYFGGLTSTEVAEALGVSATTIKREWSLARAWLYRFLTQRDTTKPG
jgi:RNA polymerase sigma factor (TIGR02999 family)